MRSFCHQLILFCFRFVASWIVLKLQNFFVFSTKMWLRHTHSDCGFAIWCKWMLYLSIPMIGTQWFADLLKVAQTLKQTMALLYKSLQTISVLQSGGNAENDLIETARERDGSESKREKNQFIQMKSWIRWFQCIFAGAISWHSIIFAYKKKTKRKKNIHERDSVTKLHFLSVISALFHFQSNGSSSNAIKRACIWTTSNAVHWMKEQRRNGKEREREGDEMANKWSRKNQRQ